MHIPVAVLGASGYAGVELTRLLALHPGIVLAAAGSDRWAGELVEARTGVAAGALRYTAPAAALAAAGQCQIALLALPAEASLEAAPVLLARGVRVIDLSGAFRLRDAALYPGSYGFAHAEPALLAEAVYGLTERARAEVGGARLVANPGCYATAIQLALAPLVADRLLAPGPLVVDAMSGVTGAGRKATEDMSFVEVAGDLRAYRVLRHQHAPEIEQGLGGARVRFVPHLVPLQRGILATCHAQLAPGAGAAAVAATYERAYAREPFVVLAPSAEQVSVHAVVGTNRCMIGSAIADDGALVVVAAIDNLVKGAAGQAVQNMNAMLGLAETTGLAALRSFHP